MKENELDDFLKQYIQRGWGSMSKRDFEVWIFHLFMENPTYEDKTAYDLALEFKIPESRVRNLQYEAQLKYGLNSKNVEQYMKDQLLETLKKVKYKKSEKLQFVVTDKLLRQYISDVLSKVGRFFDTSFNSNIVSISIDDFVALITDLYGEEKMKELVDSVKSKLDNKDFPTDTPSMLKKIVVSFAEGVLKDTVGEFTIEALSNGIKDIAKVIKSDPKRNIRKRVAE